MRSDMISYVACDMMWYDMMWYNMMWYDGMCLMWHVTHIMSHIFSYHTMMCYGRIWLCYMIWYDVMWYDVCDMM